MGRSGSSSKKKYSKKKSLKVSSEERRLKRSKIIKSKKLRRHDSSSSSPSCSDDDSTSSSPLSSSSYDAKYKTRKSRSHTRSEVKSSKKRTRRRSCSEDSSDEYDSPPVKKRKRSKKNKKKIKKIKKKHRKDAYITSDSESCSISGDGGSYSDTDKDTVKGKTGNIENVMLENNPRRLKSVITVATKPDNEEGDDNDTKRDDIKEEMVHDYDYDYPSCKSNDSNEGKEKEMNDDSDNNNVESGVVVDDLESVLRKKALENLSRFRGGIQLQTKPVVVTTPVVDNNNNKQINDQSGVVSVSQQDSQPVIQRSRFTWRRDDAHATYSGPESSRSQPPIVPKLQTAGLLSSTDRLENKTTNEISENKITNEISENKTNNTHESIEVKKSTGDLETPSSSSMKEGKQTGTSDNSQFEKKTMSVMRGGEMVQVSYKVYIPNRAPALARRKLTR